MRIYEFMCLIQYDCPKKIDACMSPNSKGTRMVRRSASCYRLKGKKGQRQKMPGVGPRRSLTREQRYLDDLQKGDDGGVSRERLCIRLDRYLGGTPCSVP